VKASAKNCNRNPHRWKAVEGKIHANFGPDTIARYELIGELFQDEAKTIEAGKSDEARCAFNYLQRIVPLLSELERSLDVRQFPLPEASNDF
jgi:hypothetical protein